jgi:hypothetical protein
MKARLVHLDKKQQAAYFLVDKLWEWHEKAVEKRLFDRGLPIRSVRKVVHEGRGMLRIDFAMGFPASGASKVLNEASSYERPDARTIYKATAPFFLRDYFSSTKWHGPMVVEPEDEFMVVGNFTGNNIVIQIRTGKNKDKRGLLSAQEWDTIDTKVEARGHVGDYDTPFAKTDRIKIRTDREDAVSALQRTGHDTNNGTRYKQVYRNFPDFPARKPIADHYLNPSPKVKKKPKPPQGDEQGPQQRRGGAPRRGGRPGGGRPRPRPRRR